MRDDDFINIETQSCFALNITLNNDGFPGDPHSVKFDYDYNGSTLHIEIWQSLERIINLSVDSPIEMKQLWTAYVTIERLLMLFDGRFYNIDSVTFTGNACSEENYASYAQECLSRRLSYYKTDRIYCYTNHIFLTFDSVMCPDMVSKWIKLQDELDIVHQIALYSIADTGVTCDVKCAYFIECLEPMAEIIGIYDNSFPDFKPGNKSTTLKMCIDAVISKYGEDIFSREYSANKDKFLQILVNMRNRIMHIKRNQPTEKYLSGKESILYLVKLCHLYRIVLLSLLGIDYEQYKAAVTSSIEQWNNWNDVLNNFITALK